MFERKANRCDEGGGPRYQSGLTPILDAMASLDRAGDAAIKRPGLTHGVARSRDALVIPRLTGCQERTGDTTSPPIPPAAVAAAQPFSDDWELRAFTLATERVARPCGRALVSRTICLQVCAPAVANALHNARRSQGNRGGCASRSRGGWPSWLKA